MQLDPLAMSNKTIRTEGRTYASLSRAMDERSGT
jgi:hypothetical protein